VVVIVEVVDKDVSLSGSSLLPTVEVDTVEGRTVDELAGCCVVVKGVSLNGSILVAVVEVIVEVVDKDVSLSGSSLIVIDTTQTPTHLLPNLKLCTASSDIL